jgi:hypothetical protein
VVVGGFAFRQESSGAHGLDGGGGRRWRQFIINLSLIDP